MQTLKKDLLATAKSAGFLSTLLKAVEAAGLTQTLSTAGPFTLFAPNDEAFKKIPSETLQALLNDKEQLTQVLTLHVLSGRHAAADVVKLSTVRTLQGLSLPVKIAGDEVHVGEAKVLTTDIDCANGIVHVIDTVLLPH